MSEDCAYFKEFLKTERRELRKAFIRHQEELSRKLKRKIARREAEIDFVHSKIWGFCKEFREEYCSKCPAHEKCELNKLRLKKTRTTRRVDAVGRVLCKALKKKTDR